MERRTININYIYIGNIITGQKISELVIVKNSQTESEAQKIFEKLSKLQDKKVDQRNKIQGKETNYYFTITKDTFFLVEATNNYQERYVFEMIDNIVNEHIPTMVNDKGELNIYGRDLLKKTVEKYQVTTSINNLENDVNDIKIEMKNAIQSQVRNLSDVSDLDMKSKNIKENASVYKKDAHTLERITWWQNCKLTIIIIAVIAVLILIIVVPIVTSSSKKI